jgi:hypothetical protein
MQKLVLAVVFMVVIMEGVFAQQFGGTPPSKKWQQINTDTARIIFPAGLDSQANRVAAIVHELARTKPVSLGDQLKKINIVLQHQTTIPNAYVGLGPFRSEFYLTPPADNFSQGSIPWNDQLALHEYRHVQQFNNFNHGLSKLMRILFGEDGYALAINAAIPDWFYEGDAVYNETQLTAQGRGKIPQFLNAFPALVHAQKNYSWMKLRNGSLKDYVPNHYEMGFLLVNYGYEKYGAEFWKNVTRDASAFKGLVYPFQAAIRKHAGVDYETFRKDAYAYYSESLLAAKSGSVGQPVFPVNKSYVSSYFFPYRSGDSLVYLKSSYRHRPAFFVRSGGQEKRIRFRNISIDQQFSYRNGKIAYASFETHPRWGWQDYSVILLVDVNSGQQTRLTSRTKYFSPDISPGGTRIAAVQNDASGRSELHILNISDGSVLQKIRASDINVFTDPKFLDEEQILTPVRLTNGKMTLALAEISTGNTMRLLPPSYNVIGYPAIDNDMIYFTATYNGNDDVYAMRRSDKNIFRITSGPQGNYFVNAGGNRISWSAFTAEGYQLMELPKTEIKWQAMDTAILERFVTPLPALDQKADVRFLQGGLDRTFPVQGYSKGKGLFNFHSWRPYFEDPIYTFSIYGQNVLNTMESEIYYKYNQEDREHGVGASATYGGWFPHINAGTEYTFERRFNLRRWSQLDSRLGVIIPISRASGQTFKDLRISNYVFLRNEFFKPPYDITVGNTSFLYLMHGISWIQQVQRAAQHIYPRLAWSVNASHRHAVTRYEGYQFFAGSSFYLPGICANHNLILSGAYQQRDTSLVLFGSRLASARGYLSYYNTNAGSRLARLSADYHLPLIHPDWGFGNILYFQRIRANLFYDHQLAYFNDRKNRLHLRSVGAEIYADTRWWNQYPLTFGVRVSRLLDDDQLAKLGSGSFVWELVLPVAIIPR